MPWKIGGAIKKCRGKEESTERSPDTWNRRLKSGISGKCTIMQILLIALEWY